MGSQTAKLKQKRNIDDNFRARSPVDDFIQFALSLGVRRHEVPRKKFNLLINARHFIAQPAQKAAKLIIC